LATGDGFSRKNTPSATAGVASKMAGSNGKMRNSCARPGNPVFAFIRKYPSKDVARSRGLTREESKRRRTFARAPRSHLQER
jgi:hypothetical protein